MDKLKQWIALTVVGVLAIMAGGYFLLVSPKKADAKDLNTQADAKDQANAVLVTQLASLKVQAKNLPAQQAALAAVAAKIPDNPALPGLIRALDKAAAAADVELVSLSPSPYVPVTAAAPTGAVTPGATRVARPAGVASSATAGTLNAIPVVLNVVGGYFQVEQFLDGLENLQRAFKVGTLAVSPGTSPVKSSSSGASAATSGRSLTASISGTVYLALGRTTAPTTTVGK